MSHHSNTKAPRFLALLLTALAPLVALRAQLNYEAPYTFSTLAGNSAHGSTDGTGTAARFSRPVGMVLDSTGNLFVSDDFDQTIRKITPLGVVTTFAGLAGSYGSGDGEGSEARFISPSGLAVDREDNIYVADQGNRVIRKITSAGVVTTFAGVVGNSGSVDGPASTAQFSSPDGLAMDGTGNLYVSDNNTIRKITSSGNVTTLAGIAGQPGSIDGTGSAARFSYAHGLAVDGSGNVYVAESGSNIIRRITPVGVVTTVAGSVEGHGSANGTGSAARFFLPCGVAVDGAGNLYVADGGNATIRKITSAGVVSTLAGSAGNRGLVNGTGSGARFELPYGVVVDGAGNLYITDSDNGVIRKVTGAGVVTSIAGTIGSAGSADGTGSTARFNRPAGVAADGAGNVYVADSINETIRKITPAGIVTTMAGSAGVVGSADGTGGAAKFYFPVAVAVDGAENVYVADSGNRTIRKITAAGVVTTLAGSAGNAGSVDGMGSAASFSSPYGVAVDRAGNVYVADSGTNQKIRKITPDGVVTTLLSSSDPNLPVTFDGPGGIAVDGSGNVYAIDRTNHRILKINPIGVVTILAGTGYDGSNDGVGTDAAFSWPAGVAADGAGNVYVADSRASLIRKVSPAGVVTTLGGDIYHRDEIDGTGSAALFYSIEGIAVDGAGNLYVADTENNTIRKGVPPVLVAPVITTQPVSQIVHGTMYGGYLVAFTAVASGFPLPTYQWQKNGIDIGGATDSWYIVYGAGPDDAGIYTVVVTNSCGSVTSDPAMLTVISAGSDFNRDGKSDILLSNTVSGDRAMWFMDGTAIETNAFAGTVPPNWIVSGTGDLDGDGKADILWTNTTTGDRAAWLMNGNIPSMGGYLGAIPVEWVVSGTGDFNGDGKSDIVWTNTSTGERAVWLMNGLTASAGASLGVVPVAWAISGTGDFNGDGKTDILLSNTTTGDRVMWLMNGTTISTNAFAGTVPPAWLVSGVGDFDGDGKADIFWSNTTTGDRAVWLMNGNIPSMGGYLGAIPGEWVVSATGDYNGDGKADILWTNTTTGKRAMWLMNGLTASGGASLGVVPLTWVTPN